MDTLDTVHLISTFTYYQVPSSSRFHPNSNLYARDTLITSHTTDKLSSTIEFTEHCLTQDSTLSKPPSGPRLMVTMVTTTPRDFTFMVTVVTTTPRDLLIAPSPYPGQYVQMNNIPDSMSRDRSPHYPAISGSLTAFDLPCCEVPALPAGWF